MSETTDATLCCVCGGPFTVERMWVEGRAYHQRCCYMSYPPHTQADYQALSEQVTRLRSELEQARGMVEKLTACVEFYADPETYHAIALLGDPPCGDFIRDLGDDDWVREWCGYNRPMPGMKARETLSDIGSLTVTSTEGK